MKQKVLCITNGIIPSSELGIAIPMLKLAETAHYSIEYEDLNVISVNKLIKKISDSDLVYLCRSTTSKDELVLRTLLYFKIPYIYEIDDNFFEIPRTTMVGRFHRENTNLMIHREFIKNAAIVRVFNDEMFEIVKKINSSVVKSRTYFNLKGAMDRDDLYKHKGTVSIGYPTGRTDDNRIERLVLNVFSEILKNSKNKIELHLWNKELYVQLKQYNNVFYHKSIQKHQKFIQYISKLNLDIGIAPLPDLRFYKCKTENKFREYAALGIVGVYSNTVPYLGVVRDCDTGMLVDYDVNSWVTAINTLVNDEKLRERIKKTSKKFVKTNYRLEDVVIELDEQITSILMTKNEKIVELSDLEKIRAKIEIRRSSDFSYLIGRCLSEQLADLSRLHNVYVNEDIKHPEVKINILVIDKFEPKTQNELFYALGNFDIVDLTMLPASQVEEFVMNTSLTDTSTKLILDRSQIIDSDKMDMHLNNILITNDDNASGPFRSTFYYNMLSSEISKVEYINRLNKFEFIERRILKLISVYHKLKHLKLILGYKRRFNALNMRRNRDE